MTSLSGTDTTRQGIAAAAPFLPDGVRLFWRPGDSRYSDAPNDKSSAPSSVQTAVLTYVAFAPWLVGTPAAVEVGSVAG